jgi:hypothetical protein
VRPWTDGKCRNQLAAGEAATGELFRIKYPDDWLEEEMYDFDWVLLRNQNDRFEKINFDAIPC